MEKQYPLLELVDPTSCTCAKIMLGDRLISNIYRMHLSRFGLSNSQITMLFVIHHKKKVSQVMLSQFMHLEKSSVSRNIVRLLKRELVEKLPDRTFQIADKGKALLEEVIPAWEDAKNEVNRKLELDGLKALELLISKLRE